MTRIDWKRGNSSMILGTVMTVMAMMFLILVAEVGNVYWAEAIVTTRTDAIADGAAVYAQSYDWTLNKPQAQIMAAMLTAANDDDKDRYKLFTSTSFADDSTMTVKGTVSTDYLYQQYHETESFFVSDSATVVAKDVNEGILVVP